MEVKHLDAYVSYFYSLKNFYIHKKKDQSTIEEIFTNLKLLEDESSNSLVDIKSGDLVAAKCESDGLWYRAEILNIEKNAFTVKFIDYGNTELSKNLKKLPKNLTSYRAMAYHCILDDIDNEEHIITINNEMYDVIFEFITTCNVILTFLNDKTPYMVKLKLDDRNIKIHLNNIIYYGIIPQTYETLKKFDHVGVSIPVKLTYIKSMNEFYVETEDSEEIKNKIEYELENGTVWHSVTEYKLGKMVIAKSETDNRWYRVRILEIHDVGKCTCYFIDYGIQEICSEFYEVFGYLESAPPFIKRCSLHMPNIKNKKLLLSSLSESFVDEMTQYINEKMIITILKAGEPCVVNLIVDDLNVADVIKPVPVVVFAVYHFNLLTIQVNFASRQYVIKEMSKIETLTAVKNPQVGKIYGVYINNNWLRAKLKKVLDEQFFEMILVDMGAMLLKVLEVFSLPEDILNKTYSTLHCSLGLDLRFYNLKKLRQLCNYGKTEFTMIVLKKNDVNGYFIKLLLDNEDVSEIIKNDNTIKIK